jgi:hypothetical protein
LYAVVAKNDGQNYPPVYYSSGTGLKHASELMEESGGKDWSTAKKELGFFLFEPRQFCTLSRFRNSSTFSSTKFGFFCRIVAKKLSAAFVPDRSSSLNVSIELFLFNIV